MAREIRFSTESIQGRRPQNEDSVLAETVRKGGLLLAVADGMGGHAAGEVASALALETVLGAVREGESLEEAVRRANREVNKRAQDPDKLGMGTTLTAMLLQNDRFFVANVGDSRAYQVSRTEIRQLTEDHSFLAEARKQGQSREEAMASPWKDSLTRSIGPEEEVEVDVFGPFPVEEDTALLICSDGLYKALGREGIREVFLESRNHSEAAGALVSAAFEAGSDDNITVAIAEFGEFPRRAVASRSWQDTERREEEEWAAADLHRKETSEGPVEAIPEDEAVILGVDEEPTTARWDEEPVVLGADEETTWAVWEGEPRILGGKEEGAEEPRGAEKLGGVEEAVETEEPGRPEATEEAEKTRGAGESGAGEEPEGVEGAPPTPGPPPRPHRQVVGPWAWDPKERPTLVGGRPPARHLWRNLILALAAVILLAVAALHFLG